MSAAARAPGRLRNFTIRDPPRTPGNRPQTCRCRRGSGRPGPNESRRIAAPGRSLASRPAAPAIRPENVRLADQAARRPGPGLEARGADPARRPRSGRDKPAGAAVASAMRPRRPLRSPSSGRCVRAKQAEAMPIRPGSSRPASSQRCVLRRRAAASASAAGASVPRPPAPPAQDQNECGRLGQKVVLRVQPQSPRVPVAGAR